jgi:hypothetical protein
LKFPIAAAIIRSMKEEVFTGNVDELLEHVTDNDKVLADAAHNEQITELQLELDQMVEEGLLECIDGKYRQI